ncbi:MAG: insulinase family protein [Gammaproteobacteria bacterium]|nr:insulinase family protein [Gammaproteobacteria bacterium]
MIRCSLLTQWTTLCAAILLAACTSVEREPEQPGPTSEHLEALAQPVKSPNDDRNYRYLTLPNDLQVLLIEDAQADKSATSLSVFRGLYSDPEQHLGMAHFLEHMLFLGTEKYPETDAYESYIATHGGTYNAYTSSDHTNYFFDIEPGHLFHALDMFSQFFIAPLFTADYVEREKNAVNSEYQLQIKDDGWRGQAVRRVWMNPEHPASRFTVGSLETLADTTRDDLIEFYERYYSSDQMALVILSNYPLDDLEAEVRTLFGPIPNRRIGASATPPQLIARDLLPSQLTFQNLKNTRRLSFNFPIPPLDDYYATKPVRYIAELIADEGAGSLHALLKDRGLIESLYGGPDRLDTSNALLSISMELTELGASRMDEIENALFAYIELLRTQGVDAWRYEEQANLAELSFRFQEKAQPIRTVMRLSANLRLYDALDVLRAPSMMEGFNRADIERFLAYLTPSNLIVEVSGPDVDTDTSEPWFNVPYRITPIDKRTQPVSAVEGIALPQRNDYVPEDLSLISTERHFAEVQETRSPAPALGLWLASDTEFGTPRGTVRLVVHVDDGLRTPEDSVRALIYARLVEDRLNARAYPAQIAGFQYRVRAGGTGFDITVSGYADKLYKLFADVVEAMTELKIQPDRLELYKESLGKDFANFNRERPYSQALASVRHLLVSTAWPPGILAAALQDVSVDDLRRWRQRRLEAVAATLFLHGNLTAEDLAAFADLVASKMHLSEVTVVDPTTRLLNETYTYELDIDHDDATFVMYLQGARTSYEERARVGLLAQILRTPYFNSLRTEQQLGYIVSVMPVVIRTQPGLAFLVQSPVASPAQIETATFAFIHAQIAELQEMPDAALEEHKNGFIARLTERDANLYTRSRRLWSDFDLGIYSFDSREQIAAEVAEITRAELITTFQKLVDPHAGNRLTVFSRGQYDAGISSGSPIDDIETFKR